MDMEVYEAICDREESNCESLAGIRVDIASQLVF